MTGCLVLHGFTSSLDTVRPLLAKLDEVGIPYEVPILRGHGGRPEDLEGVRWEHWVEDAAIGLQHLTQGRKPAVVIGHSMGGLLALDLAATCSQQVQAVVSVSTCLRFRHPGVYVLPIIEQFYPYWNTRPHYVDQKQAATHTNYRRFPTRAFGELYRYSHLVRERLPMVTCPLLVLQSSIDRTVRPRSATKIYREVSSTDKEVAWFNHTGHEMLRDAQRDAVAYRIIEFIQRQGP
ncbi:MAG TPA: alpha/beta fold hydrolase [Candidatus Xenobia bacterium]